jgi:hypothetical protein
LGLLPLSHPQAAHLAEERQWCGGLDNPLPCVRQAHCRLLPCDQHADQYADEDSAADLGRTLQTTRHAKLPYTALKE